MSTFGTLHARLVTVVDAVSGLTPSRTPFDAASIPSHGAGGWFIVRMDSGTSGGPSGGAQTLDTHDVAVEFLWDETQEPNTRLQAALGVVEAIRGAVMAVGALEPAAAQADYIGYDRASLSGRYARYAVRFTVKQTTTL